MKWKILISDGLEARGLEKLQNIAKVKLYHSIEKSALLEEIAESDALIVRSRTKVTQEVIEAAPRLKVIGRAGVGVDNIDVAAAKARGIVVVNTPTAATISVAELTIGLLLALVRSLPYADASMKAGQWQKQTLKGIELYGKRLGIIGVGRIGGLVAQYASALGMTILGYDRYLSPASLQKGNVQPMKFEELLSQSDFLSIHLPLNDETRMMIDQKAFQQMKSGIYLVNTSRGGIIDELALLDALESGKVAGAALDVYAAEPPGKTALVAHPRVIATPHIGAQTSEAQARASEQIANAVLAALEGEATPWQISE